MPSLIYSTITMIPWARAETTLQAFSFLGGTFTGWNDDDDDHDDDDYCHDYTKTQYRC